ncbi:MAG: 3-isopropylmalate dehydratase small subunit [Limnochordia bacterium]
MELIKGRAFPFGDNIDTDQIFPGRYLELTDKQAIAQHAMAGVDPDFASQVQKGDIIVAGRNFGCGSSREHAAITLKECGVGAVIARSFGRIFYRNAINLGLPVITLPEGLEVQRGDQLTIDLAAGRITVGEKEYSFLPFPEDIQRIIASGGIIPVIADQLRS